MNSTDMLNTIAEAMENLDVEALEGLHSRVNDLLVSKEEQNAWIYLIDNAYTLIERVEDLT